MMSTPATPAAEPAHLENAHAIPAPRPGSRHAEAIARADAQDRFLEAYAKLGNITAAAYEAAVGRRTHYDWLEADAGYAARFGQAEEAATDALEAEARRRATAGSLRYKFDKAGNPLRHPVTGEPYYELEFSDTLLIFLLKGARPEKHKERQEITGKDDGPAQLQPVVARLENLSVEQLEKMRELAAAAQGKGSGS